MTEWLMVSILKIEIQSCIVSWVQIPLHTVCELKFTLLGYSGMVKHIEFRPRGMRVQVPLPVNNLV